ncbi:MAG TPA: cation diffusion facilitator family transporter [Dehalococcoidales bacterium]
MMTHSHNNINRQEVESNRGLVIALGIVIVMMVVEVVGGLLSNSLALIGDAGHMFVDALALSLSLFALTLARRPATATRTYGFHRVEIMAALVNGAILAVVAAFIFYKAYQRFQNPPEIHSGLMLVIAILGLLANLAGILLLRRNRHVSLNIRAAFFHILGDTISSVGVITASIIISLTGWTYADPIIAIVISIIILTGAVQLLRESSDILLEAVPKHIEMDKVIQMMKNVEGVDSIHDLHIWTITSGIFAMSAHVVVQDVMVSRTREILDTVNRELAKHFDITHTTLQLECGQGENCTQGLVCNLSRDNQKESNNHE